MTSTVDSVYQNDAYPRRVHSVNVEDGIHGRLRELEDKLKAQQTLIHKLKTNEQKQINTSSQSLNLPQSYQSQINQYNRGIAHAYGGQVIAPGEFQSVTTGQGWPRGRTNDTWYPGGGACGNFSGQEPSFQHTQMSYPGNTGVNVPSNTNYQYRQINTDSQNRSRLHVMSVVTVFKRVTGVGNVL